MVATQAIAQPVERDSIFTARDATILGAGTIAALVTIGWDRQISSAFRESPLQRNQATRSAMDMAGFAGDPGAILAGAGLWLSGRWGNDRTRERLGLRSMEAVLLSGVFTGGIKAIAGRARPDQSPTMPRDLVIGRGFGDRSEFQSFPSGHATVAFAFASAIDAELNRIAPQHPGWIVPTLYGIAAATAVSRVYHDRHWASDVMLGSAIGFVGGRAVVRWHGDRR
jgi:membrane-associated phospholipid phosphatase